MRIAAETIDFHERPFLAIWEMTQACDLACVHCRDAFRGMSGSFARTFEGKCGACEFKRICGGSRARAYALTGNPFDEEPCCSYIPKGFVPSSIMKHASNLFPAAARGNHGPGGGGDRRIGKRSPARQRAARGD